MVALFSCVLLLLGKFPEAVSKSGPFCFCEVGGVSFVGFLALSKHPPPPPDIGGYTVGHSFLWWMCLSDTIGSGKVKFFAGQWFYPSRYPQSNKIWKEKITDISATVL